MAGFLPFGPFYVHLYFRGSNPGAIRTVQRILINVDGGSLSLRRVHFFLKGVAS